MKRIIILCVAFFAILTALATDQFIKGDSSRNSTAAESSAVSGDKTVVYPQGMESDLLAINKAHASLDNVKITSHSTFEFFLSNNETRIEESSYIIFHKGRKIRYDAPTINRIQDEKYNLLVNDSLKLIVIFDPDVEQFSYLSKVSKAFNLDSSMQLVDKVEKITSGNDEIRYVFYYSLLPYSKMEMFFNINTKLVSKIVTYYTDYDPEIDDLKQKVETIQLSYDPLPANYNKLFDTRNYIVPGKGGINATSDYKNYAVYNNMKK